jgi:hypothetical protein
MTQQEEAFTHELEVFGTEARSAIQFFYTYLTARSVLSDNAQALHAVNRTPMFWRTILGALETSFFIVLGRVFDQNSTHNIDRLLKVAEDNAGVFSKEALKTRKMMGSQNAHQWIDGYIKDAYVPTANDFRRLRRHVADHRKIYENAYRDIRRKVYAHKLLSEPEDVRSSYNKTDIKEMEDLSIFPMRLYETLWHLFHNGRKPVLRPMEHSVRAIRKAQSPTWQGSDVQELTVRETETFFGILSSIPQQERHQHV